MSAKARLISGRLLPAAPHRPFAQGAHQPHLTTEHAHTGLPVGRPVVARSDRASTPSGFTSQPQAEGELLAHRFDRPLATEMDDDRRRGSRSFAAAGWVVRAGASCLPRPWAR